MNGIYELPLVLEPQPEGGYTVTLPLLPELIAEADDISQVLPHVADALAAVIEFYQDSWRPLPVFRWGLFSLASFAMGHEAATYV
ncbi:MAG TPA: type II toxin-antitoxin system HicB family antitoxin [Anaerolineae bacterium]|nr:type II toxin-antitoxin system HicB family antitoxin [Anaerolineae bacterium]HNU03663.1 type II toxin-antitoxin system HicB family antitoxin [Anaerolineae bacterium]